ncbi:MAG: hypothetical protein MUE96_11955 [Bacteroidia bacterium]|nr:hypothetical protein [Bacteroidia bacterium]
MKTPIYPFKPATLVIPAPSSKNQSWLIKFYVWHVGKQKLEMQRDYECNYIKDIEQRKKWCKQRIKEINVLLSTGVYIDDSSEGFQATTPVQNSLPQNPIQQPTYNHIEHGMSVPTIIEGIDLTLKEKRGLKHFRDYNQKLNKFKDWIYEFGLQGHSLTSFSHKYIKQFIESLKQDGLQTRTINNYINTIGLVFNTYNEQEDNENTVKNPIEKIKKDKNPKGKNIAFVQEQQKKILEFIAQSNFPHYELISITMFYTLARTKELSYLQPWMIGAKQHDQIHFPAEICKNGIEKNVTITDELEEIFTKYRIRELPKNWYVFGKGLKPGSEHYNEKFIGTRYRENVLDKLDFSMDYTLYSWKHTGVCMYYLNGVSVALLMMQAGWEDPHTFKKYLKSLGLFDNTEIKAKSPKLPM